MEGEDHRMLKEGLAEIRSEVNKLTEAVGNVGTILTGFFRAYAKAASTAIPQDKTAAWRDTLKRYEEG